MSEEDVRKVVASYDERDRGEDAEDLHGSLGKLEEWCGCGDHERVDAMMLAYLATLDAPSGISPDWPDPDGAPDSYVLLAYIADKHEWTEHGSTIRFPWLTDAGREQLRRMRNLTRSAVGSAVGPDAPSV